MTTFKPQRGTQINKIYPLARGLVGCWLFNEGSGSIIADCTSNGSDGTFVGSPVWVPGNSGSAVKMSVTGNGVNLGSKDVLRPGEITVVVFGSVESNNPGGAFIAQEDVYNNNKGWNLKIIQGSVYWQIGNGSARATVAFPSVTAGQRYMFVGSYDGQYARGWLNNQELSAASLGGSIVYNVNSVLMGSLPGWTFHDSTVEYALVYNRALSAAEVGLLVHQRFCMFDCQSATVPMHVPIYEAKLTGNTQSSSEVRASAQVNTSPYSRELAWQDDVLFNAVTSRSLKLGTALTMGWFWVRPRGCLAVYRGSAEDNIDCVNPVTVADSNTEKVRIPVWIEHQPGEEYYYLARRYNRIGCCEQGRNAVVKFTVEAE